MSRRTWISCLVGVVVFAGTAFPLSTSVAAPSAAATATSASARTALTTVEFEKKLLALTNARRKKVGCPALKANTALTKAARAHTRLMVAAGKLSHQLPREASLAKRIQKAGYKNWTAAAENIAWGAGSPASVFSMWMNSSGHRKNIERCVYRDAGFGVAYKKGAPWVTLDLGRRR